MKKLYVAFVIAILSMLIISMEAAFNPAHTYSSGSPGGYTNSPGDGGTCNSCHSGSLMTGSAAVITSDIPASGYVPGTTYTVTATITVSGVTKFGFEISPQTTNGTLVGSWTLVNANETKIVNGGKAVTHTGNGNNGNGTRSWTMQWKAPATSQGGFSFYAAFNASNANGSSSGDKIYTASLAVSAASAGQSPTAAFSANNTNVCKGNTTTFTSQSTGSPTSYEWFFGAGANPANATTAGPHSVIYTTSGNKSVTLTVKNSNGSNTKTLTDYIHVNTDVIPSILSKNITCNGAKNGSATASATGGTSPYTYTWSNGTTASSISSLSSGTYTVTVLDNISCSATQSTTITEPSPIILIVNGTKASAPGKCDGAINTTVSGGTPGYTFAITPNIPGSNGNYSNVCEGSYKIVVTDANSCTSSKSQTIQSSAPASLLISGTVIHSDCANTCTGSISVTVSGGVSPYTYKWSQASLSGSEVSNLCPKTYLLTVTDANGSTKSTDFSVLAPPALSKTKTVVDADCKSCPTGSACTNITGGNNSAYTYKWSSGETTKCIQNKVSGQYFVTAQDANNCEIKDTAIIKSRYSSPALKTILLKHESAPSACDGTTGVAVQGGLRPYKYKWTPSGQTDSTITNLCPGVYCVSLEDALGQKIDTCLTIRQAGTSGLGTEVITERISLQIIPNPNQGCFLIKTSDNSSIGLHFNLYDLNGTLIQSIDGSEKQEIYFCNYLIDEGFYLLGVFKGNTVIAFKQVQIIK